MRSVQTNLRIIEVLNKVSNVLLVMLFISAGLTLLAVVLLLGLYWRLEEQAFVHDSLAHHGVFVFISSSLLSTALVLLLPVIMKVHEYFIRQSYWP